MGFIFKLFKIIGIDLSYFNDNPNTEKVVDPQKIVETGIDFVAMRSSVGKWLDTKFKQYWAALRGYVLRIQYHYMDYYSHVGLGLTAKQWGEVQAQTVYDSTKADNDGCIAFLDIEKASFAARIEDVLPLVKEIASAFLVKLDALNGKKNGLYLSLSYLTFFLFAKDRPLWLALYNEYYTPAQAVSLARSKGWTGPVYIWQYASDGDIDDDGTADGLKIGVESATVDLNIWVASEEEYKNFGKVSIVNPNPVDPNDEFMAKCTATSLYIRSLPSISGAILGNLSKGDERLVIEINNGWYKIGDGKWVSGLYMQKLDTPVIPTPEPEPIDMANVMNIEPLSQVDASRKDITFGNTKIGYDGCLTVDIEMMLNYLGLKIDTAGLVTWLKANEGYYGNLFVWKSIEKLLPGLTFNGKYTGARLDLIEESLSRKMPVLVHVDFDPATSLVEQHWAFIIGKSGASYIAIDPKDGAKIKLDERYEQIYNVATYSFTGTIFDAEKLSRLWNAHPDLH